MKALILLCASILAVAQTSVNGGRTTLGPVDSSGATHTMPLKIVASTGSLPASGCTPGELAIVTGATIGQQIYENSGTGSCTWTQQLNSGGGGGGGGGIAVYSAAAVGFSGTQYLPIGGSTAISGTEANVQTQAPAAATIANFTVQITVAPGMGNSIVFTLRKAAADQAVTCTISGAVATSCTDTTHSFNASQTDLLDVKAVTTGSVGTPNVTFAFQFGTIGLGTITSGTTSHLAYYPSSGTTLDDSGRSLLVGTSAIDFGSINDATCLTSTFALSGAATTDYAAVLRPSGLADGLEVTAWVSAVNTVKVQVCNFTGASVDPASLTYGVALIK